MNDMIVRQGRIGARGVDSYQASALGKRDTFDLFRKNGVDFFVGYLGLIDKPQFKAVLDAGLAFMPVTLGMKHDVKLTKPLGHNYGGTTVKQCQSLGLPLETTVWLDLEGCPPEPANIIAYVKAWTDVVARANYMPGLYVGAGAQLTGKELYSLPVVRYWESLSKETDRNGQIAEPNCGWCMAQLYPSVQLGNFLVDYNFIQKDFRGRLPNWVEAT